MTIKTTLARQGQTKVSIPAGASVSAVTVNGAAAPYTASSDYIQLTNASVNGDKVDVAYTEPLPAVLVPVQVFTASRNA